MWRCWLFVALSGCGNGSPPPPLTGPADASLDAFGNADAATCVAPPLPACAVSCGNGQIDACHELRTDHGVCRYETRTEMCDGASTPTCDERGYFGTASPCANCYINDAACEACDPAGVGCVTLGTFRVGEVAASGSLLAIMEPGGTVGPPPRFSIIDQQAEVASLWPEERGTAIVGVPGGWLVATSGPGALHTLSASGTYGAGSPIDTDTPALAYGPGQRVIVAWSEYVQSSWQTFFELTDAGGQLVLPKTLLVAGGEPGVGTDGTSFFVGTGGALAKIAADGTRSITTGFPTGAGVHVSWHGTTGWYVAIDATVPAYAARRFGADGVALGATIAIGQIADVIADGNDLLVLRYVGFGGRRLVLERIDPSGTTVATTVVGAGVSTSRIVRAGGSLYVAWSWPSRLHIALVSI